ncbi:hypothetical protein ACFE04_024074 [Oxalis oulophora]
MTQGGGHAIFTAECSHSFHFHCIASNVKHDNQICPICRAKWIEIPLQGPSTLMTVVRRLPPARRDLSRQHVVPLFQTPEPKARIPEYFKSENSFRNFPNLIQLHSFSLPHVSYAHIDRMTPTGPNRRHNRDLPGQKTPPPPHPSH